MALVRTQLRPALMSLFLLTVLTGLVYPLLATGIAQVVFPRQATGSLLADPAGSARLGSGLIGQPFDDPGYFWGRPSATGSFPYNAGASSGSNLGPRNMVLREAVQARISALKQADPGMEAPIPVDLVTASGSGLDPHISPAAAVYQVRRVASARGLSEERVRQLVAQHVEGRQWELLGEPRINVLQLNLALDALDG